MMHPDDEAEFAEFVMDEPGMVFVDGPKWDAPQPPIIRDIKGAGDYLMIWNPEQTPRMKAKHHDNEHGEWWYCETEHFTIQFLRSGFQFDEPFLFEGRIAVSTTDKNKGYFHKGSAALVEQRYKNLRKWIRKMYTNNLIVYQMIGQPRSATNPTEAASDVWVGRHAFSWLNEKPNDRWVQQSRFSLARGYLVDRVDLK